MWTRKILLAAMVFLPLPCLAVPVLTGEGSAGDAMIGKPLLSNPDWADKPGDLDIAAAFPLRARLADKAGVGAMACLVAADGKLTGCAVTQDVPEGFGFGAAMLSLAGKYRVRAMLIDGKAQIPAGYVVRIRVDFRSDRLNAGDRPEP